MGFASPSEIMDRLKQKVAPIADKAKSAAESYQNKGLTSRFVDGVVKGSAMVARPTLRAATNVVGRTIEGHWNASGLNQVFGSLPIGKHGRKMKRRRQYQGTIRPTSGIGSNDANRIIAAIRSSMANISQALDGIDGSMAGLRDDIQKLQDINRRGFLALLRTFNSHAPNPFAGMSQQRRAKPPTLANNPNNKNKSVAGSAGSLLSRMLGGLFGKTGILATALSGLVGIASRLAGIVGSLIGSVGMLGRLAAALAGPLARGLAGLAGGAALALGRGARGLARSIGRSVARRRSAAPRGSNRTQTPIDPKAGKPSAKPATAARPGETVKSNAPDPKPQQKAPIVDANGKAVKSQWKPAYDPEAAKPNNAAKAEAALKETVTKLEPKAVEPPKAPTVEPKSTPEAPKPVTEPTKGTASKGTTGTSEVAKDGLKSATKIGSGALTKALLRVGVPVATIGIEAWDGYNEWSEAYDKFKAGEISEDEYKKVQTTIVGKHTGAMAGALGGGAIGALGGSFFGPVGTFVGGVGGSIVGGYYGSKAGEALSDTVLGQVLGDAVAGRTKAQPQSKPAEQPNQDYNFTVRETERTSTPEGNKTTTRIRPATPEETQRMIAASERQAQNKQSAPVIINAPQTTNNNNSSSGGGNGNNKHSPGSAVPSFSGLDFNATGMGIPGLPGSY